MKRHAKFICMILTIIMLVFENGGFVYAEEIGIGDYIQMGEYNGQKMKWRIIDENDNGFLLLADKIIDYKMYDAPGSNLTSVPGNSHSRDVNDDEASSSNKTRKGYGSNYWADSNIRSWLNSNQMSGNIEWLCGNPPAMNKPENYKDTDGFLTNFTESELAMIKTVSQKTVVSGLDAGEKANDVLGTSDVTGLIDPALKNVTIGSGIISNSSLWYSQYVSDKVFLLDMEQLVSLYNKSDILGDFYVPKNQDGEPVYALYRNPVYDDITSSDRGSRIRVHNAVNTRAVSGADSSNSMTLCAVRPAFYIDSSTVYAYSGDGTEIEPYPASKSLGNWSYS